MSADTVQLTRAQVLAVLVEAGWPEDEQDNGLCVSWEESRCRT